MGLEEAEKGLMENKNNEKKKKSFNQNRLGKLTRLFASRPGLHQLLQDELQLKSRKKGYSRLDSPPPAPAKQQQQSFRFLDLPRELQDQILEYVLTPGEVHLEAYTTRWGLLQPILQSGYMWFTRRCGLPLSERFLHHLYLADRHRLLFPDRRFLKIGGPPSHQQQGFQILAACRTLYENSYKMFYSQNTFYMQPGPIPISSAYFEDLQPKHRELIRSMVVSFTLADLTPEVLRHIEGEISRYSTVNGRTVRSMSQTEQVTAWTDVSMDVLELLWFTKLKWLLQWPHLERLEVCAGRYSVVIRGNEVARNFNGENSPQEMRVFWRSCNYWARKKLREKYLTCGLVRGAFAFSRPVLDVEVVKSWLADKSPRLRCKY